MRTAYAVADRPVSLPNFDISGTSGIPISRRCSDSLAGRTGGFRRAQAAWPTIHDSAAANDIDPRILAAIGVRETNFRDRLGYDGHGHGIFQLDDQWNPPSVIENASNLPFASNYAAGKLATNMNAYLKQGYNYGVAVAAAVRNYNGTGGIPTSTLLRTGYAGYFDLGTTHNNYVSDVLSMAVNCF